MKFKVLYNPDVYTNIQESVDWYNEQQPGLGRRFYLVLKNHLRELEKVHCNMLSDTMTFDVCH